MRDNKRWLDPVLQVTIVGEAAKDESHLCISGDADAFDNGNHFGFTDPDAAIRFADRIRMIALRLREEQEQGRDAWEARDKAIEKLGDFLFWNGVCNECGSQGKLVSKTLDKIEGVELLCPKHGFVGGWRALALRPRQIPGAEF